MSPLVVPAPRILPLMAPPVMSIVMLFGAALMSIAVPPVPVMVPELTMAPRKVATLAPTTMPVWATIWPLLTMLPPALAVPKTATLDKRMPPPLPVIVPLLTMAPTNVLTCKTRMASLEFPPRIAPLLTMLPEKVDTPSTSIALRVVEIVPALRILPEKLETA